MTTFEPLGRADLLALRAASTATLSAQLFRLGLRNQVLAGLRPLSQASPRMVGEAFTLRYIPAREDIDTLDVYDDYDHSSAGRSRPVPRATCWSWTAGAKAARRPPGTSC